MVNKNMCMVDQKYVYCRPKVCKVDQKFVWWTSPIELWAASSLLRGGGGLRWPTFKPLHHSLLSTALPRSPLAKEKTSCSQRCTSPSSENSRIGQIEQRSENINLHYPPLVIHFLIAQNLWPPLIAGICLVVPKLVAAAPNHQTVGCLI